MSLKIGSLLVAIDSFEQHGLLHFMSPFTGGFLCVIKEKTEFEVITEPSQSKGGFYARPVEYDNFESKYVPISDRKSPKYDGYSFIFNVNQIGKQLRVKGS